MKQKVCRRLNDDTTILKIKVAGAGPPRTEHDVRGQRRLCQTISTVNSSDAPAQRVRCPRWPLIRPRVVPFSVDPVCHWPLTRPHPHYTPGCSSTIRRRSASPASPVGSRLPTHRSLRTLALHTPMNHACVSCIALQAWANRGGTRDAAPRQHCPLPRRRPCVCLPPRETARGRRRRCR